MVSEFGRVEREVVEGESEDGVYTAVSVLTTICHGVKRSVGVMSECVRRHDDLETYLR